VNDSNFNENIKTFILEKVMPEFIWIGEISSKQLIKQKQANGLVIIDATENSIKYFDSLIFAGYADRFYHLNYTCKELQEVLLSLGTFNIYTNNLKGF
jgi:hypothetical protein